MKYELNKRVKILPESGTEGFGKLVGIYGDGVAVEGTGFIVELDKPLRTPLGNLKAIALRAVFLQDTDELIQDKRKFKR